MYFFKYSIGFLSKACLQITYGSYHRFVNNLDKNVAKNIPNNPQALPSKMEKSKFNTAVPNCTKRPYRNIPIVCLKIQIAFCMPTV